MQFARLQKIRHFVRVITDFEDSSGVKAVQVRRGLFSGFEGVAVKSNGTLRALRKALEFLDRDRSIAVYFEESEICCKSPYFSCRSSRCPLMDFVPEEFRSEATPCRHIPLTEKGESLDRLYRTRKKHETDVAVKTWLGSAIARLESVSSNEESVRERAA